MAYGLSNVTDGAVTTNNANPVALSLLVPDGATIIVWCVYEGAAATLTVTDNKGNQYNQCGAQSGPASSSLDKIAQFEAHNVVGGVLTVSMNISAARANKGAMVTAWAALSGAAPESFNTNAYDASAGTGIDAVNSGNITPVHQPGLLAGLGVSLNGASVVATSAATVDRGEAMSAWDASTGNSSDWYEQRLTSTATTQVKFTQNTGGGSFLAGGIFFSEVGPPVVTQQPVGATINDGDYWYGWVNASDSSGAGLTYQWQQNTGAGFSDILGQTGQYFTAGTRLHVADTGIQYRCNVTNSAGTTASAAATVVVQAARSGRLGDFHPLLRIKAWF